MSNFKHEDLCKMFPCLKNMDKDYINTLCVFSILSTYMSSSEYVRGSENYLTPLMRAVLSIEVILEEFKSIKFNSVNKEKYYSLVIIAYENYTKIYNRKVFNVKTIYELFNEHKEYEDELRLLWKTSLRDVLQEYSIESLAE